MPPSGLHAFVAERAGLQSRRYSLCEVLPVAQRASSAWSEVQRAVDTSAADATHRFKGSVATLTMTFEPRPVLGTWCRPFSCRGPVLECLEEQVPAVAERNQ